MSPIRGLNATRGSDATPSGHPTLGGPQTLGWTTAGWTTVCPVERVIPDRGVAALIEGRAVAVFVLASGDAYAVDNLDPYSGASVLSRGIVGDVDGAPTVASPMYKQRFDLRTGVCLDGLRHVAAHEARIVDGMIEVRVSVGDGEG